MSSKKQPPGPGKLPPPSPIKVLPGVITGFVSAKDLKTVEAPDLQVFASWSLPSKVASLPPLSNQSDPGKTEFGPVKKTSDGRFSRRYTIKNLPGVPIIQVSASSLNGKFTAEADEKVILGTKEGKSGVNLFLEP